MNNKLITIVLTLVVGTILAGSLLVPVLNDACKTEETIHNDGIVRMTKYDTTAEINAFWDHTKPNEITVNDEVVKLPKFVTSGVEISLTVSGAADFLIRYVSVTATNQTLTYSDALGNTTAGANSNTDATITVSGGTITFSNGTTTKTGTYEDYLFFVSNDGDYVMKASDDIAVLKEDSDIYGIGRTKLGTINYSFVIEGTIADGWTANIVQTNTVTLSEVTGNYQQSTKYVGGYDFVGVGLTATVSDVDYPVTYNQVIVPYEVTLELTEHLTAGQIALLSAIPIMVIVALLVVAVGVVARRNE